MSQQLCPNCKKPYLKKQFRMGFRRMNFNAIKESIFKALFIFAKKKQRIEMRKNFIGDMEVVVVFKKIGNREIILEEYIAPPVHYSCRCASIKLTE